MTTSALAPEPGTVELSPGSSPGAAFIERIAMLVESAERLRDEEVAAHEAERTARLAVAAEFERLVERLHTDEVRPRIEAVASHFAHARVGHTKGPTGMFSVCTLPRAPRFPATTTLTLGVAFDRVALSGGMSYRLQIVPMLMEFDGSATLPLHPDSADAAEVGRWVEQHLERFVETYLRIERDPNYRRATEHVDPVCGMRVREATGVTSRVGRADFWFCGAECRERFETDPTLYLDHTG